MQKSPVDIAKNQNVLRKEMLSKRKNYDPEMLENKSRIICEKIAKSKWYLNSTSLYFYAPINGEVNLWPLIEDAFSRGKIVSFPKVCGDRMKFYLAKSKKDLEVGAYHILEPIKKSKSPQCEIIFVPGLVFSMSGARIGYGRGYYDRFLDGIKAKKVGICYAFQIVDDLAQMPHDISMDCVVCEEDLERIVL